MTSTCCNRNRNTTKAGADTTFTDAAVDCAVAYALAELYM